MYQSIALTDAKGIVHVTDDRRITVLSDGSVVVGAALVDESGGRTTPAHVSHDVSQVWSADDEMTIASGGIPTHSAATEEEWHSLLAHAELLGVASANPITYDELAGNTCTTYFGRAQAIWRVPVHLTSSL